MLGEDRHGVMRPGKVRNHARTCERGSAGCGARRGRGSEPQLAEQRGLRPPGPPSRRVRGVRGEKRGLARRNRQPWQLVSCGERNTRKTKEGEGNQGLNRWLSCATREETVPESSLAGLRKGSEESGRETRAPDGNSRRCLRKERWFGDEERPDVWAQAGSERERSLRESGTRLLCCGRASCWSAQERKEKGRPTWQPPREWAERLQTTLGMALFCAQN
jgi:hypothetical protein